MDRRRFVRTASGLVVAASLGYGCGAGGGPMYEFGFEDGTKGGLTNSVGGPCDGTVINSDAVLGSRCLNNTDTATSGLDTGFSIHRNLGQDYRDLWVRFALKHANNVSPGIQKLLRIETSPGVRLCGTFDANGVQAGDGFSWYWDNLASGGDGGYAISPASLLGQWHWYEFHLQYPVRAKAHLDMYLDGVLKISSDSNLTNDGTYAIRDLQFGGTVNAITGPDVTFDTRFDQIGISTQKMGIPTQSSNP